MWKNRFVKTVFKHREHGGGAERHRGDIFLRFPLCVLRVLCCCIFLSKFQAAI